MHEVADAPPIATMSSGQHDGYAPVRHTREVMALHGTGWIIVDRLTGGDRIEAAAMWHVHPDWSLEGIERQHRADSDIQVDCR